MPRANRYHVPGYIWHITHRCHKKEFLLRFARDRRRWLFWLLQAKNRYGLKILNYAATSNHIHLLVLDGGKPDVIPKSVQLAAGRTGQEYNHRKDRRGAFWEDRYHATAVESGQHLMQCLVYIDLNMVRAGVVKDPADWRHCGCYELQQHQKRGGLIDYPRLMSLLKVDGFEELRDLRKKWITEMISARKLLREKKWTESIAVGSQTFVGNIKTLLGSRADTRKVIANNGTYELKERRAPYSCVFEGKKRDLSP